MKDYQYSSLFSIREEAGVLKRFDDQPLVGDVDGTNKKFIVNDALASQQLATDAFSNDDVICYQTDDNGDIFELAVGSIKPGKLQSVITLRSAPDTSNNRSDKVFGNFATSSSSDAEVEKVRTEAIDYVNTVLAGRVSTDWKEVPAMIQTVVRLYAGGLIMIVNTGMTSANREDRSVDGESKIKLAKETLMKYVQEVQAESGTRRTDPVIKSGKPPFSGEAPQT